MIKSGLRFFVTLLVAFLQATTVFAQAQSEDAFIAEDGVLRYYRLALPVTTTCFQQHFGEDRLAVEDFWQEAESALNNIYVPLGVCFEVVKSDALVATAMNDVDYNPLSASGLGTELLNAMIGEQRYDVGLWIANALDFDNNGASVAGGAFLQRTKGGGYSAPNATVVAHELGHMFGALHPHDYGSATEPGMGQSIMGYGEQAHFFSVASIRQIRSQITERCAAYYADKERTQLVGSNEGGNYVWGVKVENNAAPTIIDEQFQTKYRIPQGANFCMTIVAHDADDDRLTYTLQQYEDGAAFCAKQPSADATVDFKPQYTRFEWDDYFFINDGTDMAGMEPATYRFAAVVNDLPKDGALDRNSMERTPFYSNYDVRKVDVTIVAGTPFGISLSPNKATYEAGERVKVSWGVNTNYFTAESKLRICLSDDYGNTYPYELATNVSALDGECEVVMPNVSFDTKECVFGKVVASVRPGIVRVEEIGGIAYAQSLISPMNDAAEAGFTMTGAIVDEEPLVGDVDGDGQVNVVDVSSIVNLLLGAVEGEHLNKEAADVNRDGKVDVVDVSALVSTLLNSQR